MKANHNYLCMLLQRYYTVSKSKITKKWKPITTCSRLKFAFYELFQRAKLQKNESQSQHLLRMTLLNPTVSKSKITKKWKPITTINCFQRALKNCFKEQNYKKMKANHNYLFYRYSLVSTVSKSKITKKWKPITTSVYNNNIIN